jgi:hypothetical protein
MKNLATGHEKCVAIGHGTAATAMVRGDFGLESQSIQVCIGLAMTER